ncbi:MAG: phosphate signaling complex protein PhoU [Desulfobacteraceae bacterium]|nr:MAG: phosphate signaling complex protein PhoU [Desulfobacteraceae bacterium]
MLKKDLDLLVKQLLESASLVKGMIQKSIRGLTQKEKDVLLEVIEQDEPKENELEIAIEESCIQQIACYQPQAKDLRTIMMVMKMNNDLERMGDEAVNISESALFLIEKPEVKPLIDIPRMAEEATKMIEDSLKSFINEDIQLAQNVCERDDIVDGLRDQILRELITFMAADPTVIEPSIRLIRISRSLERIADLSTNICEDVIYMAEGRIIKHGQVNT